MEISGNINAIGAYTNRLNDNAQELASETFQNEATDMPTVTQANSNNSDITRNLTDNISIQNGFDAQIRSINANDEILGTMLDIKS